MSKKDKKPAGERVQEAKAKVRAAAESVKRTASDVAGKFKGKVNKVTQTVKVKVKDYTDALQEAHDAGFKEGWIAHETLPKVPGAGVAATVGFGKGIKARAKHNKAQEHLDNSQRSTRSAKRQTAKS